MSDKFTTIASTKTKFLILFGPEIGANVAAAISGHGR
jgi:hypothetical protein